MKDVPIEHRAAHETCCGKESGSLRIVDASGRLASTYCRSIRRGEPIGNIRPRIQCRMQRLQRRGSFEAER